MFLIRVFEKKEEVVFIFYFNGNAKSPIISISDVLLEKEEALFI
jgi:hypothetical protein